MLIPFSFSFFFFFVCAFVSCLSCYSYESGVLEDPMVSQCVAIIIEFEIRGFPRMYQGGIPWWRDIPVTSTMLSCVRTYSVQTQCSYMVCV